MTILFEDNAVSTKSVGAKGTGTQARLVGGKTSGPPTTGTWAQNDISPDATGSIWLCITAGTPGVWIRIGRTTVFDIRDYGAKVDGSTDDTAAVASADAAARATVTPGVKAQNGSGTFQAGSQLNGGGIVYFPPGVTVVSNIVLGHRVMAVGAGSGSIVRQKASSTGPVFTNQFDGTMHAKYCVVQDLAVDGNKANQSSSTNHAIHWVGDETYTYTSTLDEDWDANNVVQNVYVWNVKGDGLHTTGSGENRINNFKVRSVDGNGMYVEYDNFITHVTIGHTGLSGFVATGNDNRISGIKCWYNGEITAASGQAFLLQGDSGTLADCSAQDCTAQGILFDGAFHWAVSAFMSDSVSKGSAGSYAHYDFYQSENNKVDGTATNRYNAGGPGTVALKMTGACKQNKIDINPGTGVWGITTLVMSGSSLSGNSVNFGANQGGYQEVSYAATVTPNPLLGEKIRIADVTGTLALANPTWKWPGAELNIRAKVDATGGYTITLGSDYSSEVTLSNSANALNRLRLVYSSVTSKWELW